MSIIDKKIVQLAQQIKKASVTIPKNNRAPHKIQDDNQAISIGVINEEFTIYLRSTSSIRP